jgi:hypothetical protein
LDLDLGPLQTLQFRDFLNARVDTSSGGSHVSTLRLYTDVYAGITGSGTVPVTDPETSGAVRSIRVANVTLGSGTLTGISGAPPLGRNEIPLKGFVRVCLIVGDCALNVPLNLTLNDGNTGVGVGGLLTGSFRNSVRISIVNAPWTLGTVSGINQTVHGGFKTISRAGFVHGGGSATSATVVGGATVVIQLIAPQQVTTQGIAGNNDVLMLFPTLTILAPEPGLLLLIGSGVLGLGVLGRSRMKKPEKHPDSERR